MTVKSESLQTIRRQINCCMASELSDFEFKKITFIKLIMWAQLSSFITQ